jgi:hypothetical protein
LVFQNSRCGCVERNATEEVFSALKTRGEETVLTVQADAFAGVNAEEKVGLLRSVP